MQMGPTLRPSSSTAQQILLYSFPRRQNKSSLQWHKMWDPSPPPPSTPSPHRIRTLTHWGRDKMVAISQITFSNAFFLMKMYEFLLRFPKVPIYNIPALVQIMAWRRPGDKPLSEPMMVTLLMHSCITQPQWVNWVTKRSLLKPQQQ